MLRQVWLVEPGIRGAIVEEQAEMTCWLDLPSALRVGTEITLKEVPNRRWKIAHIYEQKVERGDIKRGWNNNI
jgi:hypothetical protein